LTRRGWIAVGSAVVVAAAAGAVFVVAPWHGGGEANTIVVSDSSCASGWTAPRSGSVTFTVRNTSPKTTFGVELLSADQKLLYAKAAIVGPSTEVALPAVLPPGSYLFNCQGSDGYALISPAGRVTGPPVRDAHPAPVVYAAPIQLALDQYRASLLRRMQRLGTDTDRLTAAVRAGRLAEARERWLPAHLDYSRLGVAYDTFGKFNDEIDERPLGLPGGVHDADFQGFLRLEYGLWHGQPQTELLPVATRLDRAVHGLLRQFPTMQMASGDLPLRAHEILENTLQFELTGETDEGSHTNLATAWANVQGTDLAINALAPLLRQTDPRLLGGVTSRLTRLAGTLRSFASADGHWLALDALARSDREGLDSQMSALLEQLERVPDVLEPGPGGEDD
jgi:high-affinity iron transporter